tara:strand:- start:76 stop:543 length:468 start_codon:yes stop_codon:yes gene_type:complete
MISFPPYVGPIKSAWAAADSLWGDEPSEPAAPAPLGSDGSDGLPVGWELRTVQHKGADRPLYIDHNRRHTQWAPPADCDFARDLDGDDLTITEGDFRSDVKMTAEDEAALKGAMEAGDVPVDDDDDDSDDESEETVRFQNISILLLLDYLLSLFL